MSVTWKANRENLDAYLEVMKKRLAERAKEMNGRPHSFVRPNQIRFDTEFPRTRMNERTFDLFMSTLSRPEHLYRHLAIALEDIPSSWEMICAANNMLLA